MGMNKHVGVDTDVDCVCVYHCEWGRGLRVWTMAYEYGNGVRK